MYPPVEQYGGGVGGFRLEPEPAARYHGERFRPKFQPGAGIETDSFLTLPTLPTRELVRKVKFRERVVLIEL